MRRTYSIRHLVTDAFWEDCSECCSDVKKAAHVMVENVREGWMKYQLQALFGYRFQKGWC